MGFCERKSDDSRWVIATYLLALLPWSTLIFVDPIDPYWKPYWQVFLKTVVYFIVSIAPYGMLIPYAVLQGCSSEPDIKELLTAVVAMVASLLHVRRAIRATLALWEVHVIWKDADFEAIPFAFPRLMPELDEGEENAIISKGSVEGNIDKGCKCKLRHVLVSSALVDDTWPGDAPRVPYVTVLIHMLFESLIRRVPFRRRLPLLMRLYGKRQSDCLAFLGRFSVAVSKMVYPGELKNRRAMIAIWTLWMIRRAAVLSWYSKKGHLLVRKYPGIRDIEEVKIENLYFGEGKVSQELEKNSWRPGSEGIRDERAQLLHGLQSDHLGIGSVMTESGMLRILTACSLGLEKVVRDSYDQVDLHILYVKRAYGKGEDIAEETSEKQDEEESEGEYEVSANSKAGRELDENGEDMDEEKPEDQPEEESKDEYEVLGSSEIEKQLDKVPANIKKDLGTAGRMHKALHEDTCWEHVIVEFEKNLVEMRGQWRDSLGVKLGNSLELPETYFPVLSEWIKANNPSGKPGLLLVPVALLLGEKAERRIKWIQHMCSLIKHTGTFWDPSSEHPRSESSKLVMEIGFTIRSIRKFLDIGSIREGWQSLQKREECPFGDLSTILREILGEEFAVDRSSGELILGALEALSLKLEETSMPKGYSEDLSTSVVYRLLPSHTYFRYLPGLGEDRCDELYLRKKVSFYKKRELWEYRSPNEMIFKPMWGWLSVTTRFIGVRAGLYVASVPFLWDEALEDPPDCPSMSNYIEMQVFVRHSLPTESEDSVCFETEPIFLFHEARKRCVRGWNRIKCFNIEVENEKSDIIIEIHGQYRPPSEKDDSSQITFGAFELEMKAKSDSAGGKDVLRSARKRIVSRRDSCILHIDE